MEAKDKAIEIYKKFRTGKDELGTELVLYNSGAKQCALIAVDEVLKVLPSSYTFEIANNKVEFKNKEHDYWRKVRQEIENLK